MLESVKKQFGLLFFLVFLFFVCTVLIISFADPFKASWFEIFIFYVCLFFFCSSFFTLIFYWLRNRFSQGLYRQKIGESSREGILLSAFAVALLVLSSKQLLFWWTGFGLAAILVTVEIYFLV